MGKLLDVLIVMFEEKWVSHWEYARILAASCRREDAQRMKRLWEYHIETAAAVFDDATSTADASSERNYLESLKWQVPLACTEYKIASDDDWTSEEEGRRTLCELQRGHQQFSAHGRCPECCMRTSRAKAGERDLKHLCGQYRAWRVP